MWMMLGVYSTEVDEAMRSDDAAAALDRDEFDGDETDLFGIEPTGADPTERAEDVEVEVEIGAEADDELLEAELGERDSFVGDDPELDELNDNFDPDSNEVDDEFEMALIQELGIDLDAPDDHAPTLEIGHGLHHEDSLDDEVAA